MTASPVNLRNLERIHESASGRSPRIATFALAAAGISAVVVSGLLLGRGNDAAAMPPVDPLTALVAQSQKGDEDGEDIEVSAKELDFPEVLSDSGKPTTALVAVRDEKGQLVEQEGSAEPVPEQLPKIDTTELAKAPLPAGTLLNQTSVTAEPRDELGQLAQHLSIVPSDAPRAPQGGEGGFMIQVGSFKNQEDADRFVDELTSRGHPAFRQAANVPGRGLWHRVRIGSFKTLYEATLYKAKLEKQERLTALVIDPEKVERQQQVRAAKLAERIRQESAR